MNDVSPSGGGPRLRRFALPEFAISAALIGLALLVVIDNLHTEAAVSGIDGYGQAIDLQARQRLLAERVAHQTLQALYADSAEEATALQRALVATATAMTDAEAELLGTATPSRFPPHVPASVRKIYAGLDPPMPEALRSYLVDARLLAARTPGEIVDSRRFASLQIAQRALIERISLATQRLEAEQQRRLDRLEFWNHVYLGIMLAALFMLAFFVFRPIYARISAERTALSRDKTQLEQLSNEQARNLRAGQQKMRTILETSIDGIVTLDLHGNIMSFNRAAEKMFGVTAGEVIGTNLAMLMPEAHRERQGDGLRAAMAAGEGRIELKAQHDDGTVFELEIAFREQDGSVKRLFTAILRDLTERRRIEQMKTEFISMVSHELRTPLTSIRGSLGLIAGGAMGEVPPRMASLVEIAANNSDRLVRLINDILDIEKIEAGKMTFDLRPVPLMSCVEQAIEANRNYATRSGVRIRLSRTTPELQVRADADRLRQVLDNLLSNALKYSPSGAAVEVAVTENPGMVRVAVSDRGPGIADEFQEKIFEKFSQADSSTTRTRGGTGLGLSISKAIVERHGGRIGFDTAPGEGSTFYFDLPVYRPELVRAVVPAGSRGAPVLVVEDDADVARLLVLLLEKDGIEAEVAATAEQARAMLGAHEYRAITLDLMLPGKDGISLLRELRRDAHTRDLPVVVVSAIADTSREQLNGLATSVIDWLGKPIDDERLLAAVRQSLRAGHSATPRILHVEDDADISHTIATVLEGHARIETASTLHAAKVCLGNENFDLVILDIGLPDGSGLELLPAINARPEPPPVIVFSAHDVDADVRQLVAAALVKSRSGNEELVQQIRRALPRRPIARKQQG